MQYYLAQVYLLYIAHYLHGACISIITRWHSQLYTEQPRGVNEQRDMKFVPVIRDVKIPSVNVKNVNWSSNG